MSTGPYKALLKKLQTEFPDNSKLASNCEKDFSLVLTWIEHYAHIHGSASAEELLDAVHSSAVEVTSLLSLGLARPATFMLRSLYELYLMYLFYRHHPVEYSAVIAGSHYAKLPGDLRKFFRQYHPHYEKRYSVLRSHRSKGEYDCYELLSGVVHGGVASMLPTAKTPEQVCHPHNELTSFSGVIQNVSEVLSDTSVSVHDGNWQSLPDAVKQSLTARIQDPEKQLFQ